MQSGKFDCGEAMAEEFEVILEKLNKATGLSLRLSCETKEEKAQAMEQLQLLMRAYQSKYDKNHFVREMLEGKFDRQELLAQAAHFHIAADVNYLLLVIETKPEHQMMAVNILKEMFINRSGDMVVRMDERKIAMLKPVTKALADQISAEIETLARTSVETLNAEAMIRARVGFCEVAEALDQLSECYQRTCLALKIGHTFYNGKTVMSYQKLGIGRLIYRLPVDTMQQFLEEVFQGAGTDQLDDDMMNLINAFFKNNLNLSETARQMFVHRNTLVYRIEKLHQMTGLDLRNFDEAVELKIAMMVASCLRARLKEDEVR